MENKHFFKYIIIIFALLLTSTTFAGCKNNFSYEQKETSGTILVGQQVDLFSYLELISPPRKIEWESENPQVASVDENGIVTGKETGSTIIKTEIYENLIFFKIKVIKEVEQITLPSSIILETNEIRQIEFTALPVDATEKPVEWFSSNTAVASIENGVIQAKTEGTATITAKMGELTATSTITVKWNGKTKTEVTPVQGNYNIKNASELAWLVSEINAGHIVSPTVILTNDIDLNNKEWTPISINDWTPYKGSFDGNGKTISNLKITTPYERTGFFANCEGTIKNLTINGNIEYSNTDYNSTYCGGIVGFAKSAEIKNCVSECNIKVSQEQSKACYVGGVAGFAHNTKIKSCQNTGTLSGTAESNQTLNVCGIGAVNHNTFIFNSTNSGKLTATTGASESVVLAGIAITSTTEKTANMYGCSNLGTLILTKSGYSALVCNKNQIDKTDVYNQRIFNSLLEINELTNITITGQIEIAQNLSFNKTTSITIAQGAKLTILSGCTFETKGKLTNNGTIEIQGSSLTAFDPDETTMKGNFTTYNSADPSIKVAYKTNATLNISSATFKQNGTMVVKDRSTNASVSQTFADAIEYVLENNTIQQSSGKLIS